MTVPPSLKVPKDFLLSTNIPLKIRNSLILLKKLLRLFSAIASNLFSFEWPEWTMLVMPWSTLDLNSPIFLI